MHRSRRLGLLVLLLGLLPAAAAASPYSRVLRTYQARGSIPPCLYTGAQLASALKGVDVYGQQYFSDFTSAIESALAQRAGGACVPGGPPAAAPVAAGGPGLRLPTVTAATGAGVPLPLLGIAVLVLGGLALAGATGVRRALGAGPAAGGGAWQHLWAEVAWRSAGGWADFRDWLRAGR